VALLLPILVFGVVFGGFLVATRRSNRTVVQLGRHQIAGLAGPRAAVRTPRTAILGGGPQAGAVGAFVNRVARQEVRTKAGKLLLEAGSPMPLGTYLLLRAVLTFVGMPLFLLFAYLSYGLSPIGLVVMVVGGLAIPSLPLVMVRRKARKRAKAIEMAMPDALDLLVVCVEGGLSLDGGVQQVARRTQGVLATELSRMLSEVSTGMSRRDAFQALGARSQSQSLTVFCTTIIQADKMGMSIARTLRTLAETMRMQRRLAAETQARKAPIKMLPFLVIFMIPALFIVILGPTVLAMIKFFSEGGMTGGS